MISNDYTAESIFLNDLSKYVMLDVLAVEDRVIPANMVGVKNKNDSAVAEMF